MNEKEITVSFLDVGQGDSSIITLPDHSSAIVVDCSRDSTATIDYLRERDISTLTEVFVTHSHLDHVGGAALLLENFGQVHAFAFNLDTFLLATDTEDKSKRRTTLRHLLQLVERRGVDYSNPLSGRKRVLQGVVVDILHPVEQDRFRTIARGDINNSSVLLRVTFAGRRVLLTGDLEGRGWQWLVERETDLQSDVLKFPHHGAWYDSSGQEPSLREVLEEIDPSLVVISVGTRNSYNHPGSQTFELLRSYPQLRFICTQATWKCHSSLKDAKAPCPCAGTVEVIIGNDGMSVNPDPERHSEVVEQFDNPQCNE